MQIIFKPNIRNGYAKLEGEQIILIAPLSQKNNPTFLSELQEVGEKLKNKISKKQKNLIFDRDTVLLFGEKVPYSELPSLNSEKKRSSFFKSELFNYANPILQQYAQLLGFKDISLSIRLVKSRRGSCTADNRIMLNQNLIHLPTPLIKYVIIHEACHLREKNHGSHFRKLVETYCPHYKSLRAQLKNQLF